MFNQRLPQVDAARAIAGHQSQLQFRNLNQRLQNEGQNSYEDVRRTAGADELLEKQLPSLNNNKGRNTVNRSHFTQQQVSQVPIKSVNIGSIQNPSSSGCAVTNTHFNNMDQQSSS